MKFTNQVILLFFFISACNSSESSSSNEKRVSKEKFADFMLGKDTLANNDSTPQATEDANGQEIEAVKKISVQNSASDNIVGYWLHKSKQGGLSKEFSLLFRPDQSGKLKEINTITFGNESECTVVVEMSLSFTYKVTNGTVTISRGKSIVKSSAYPTTSNSEISSLCYEKANESKNTLSKVYAKADNKKIDITYVQNSNLEFDGLIYKLQ